MNNTNLIGRLTKKPELYQTPDKKTYARFTVAINRKGKAAENITSWADKGTLVSIEGELRTRNYEKDGQRHFVMEVWSNFFQILSKTKE